MRDGLRADRQCAAAVQGLDGDRPAENLFIVFVEPWSVTAVLYPGAKWAGGKDDDHVVMKQVTATRKLATAGGLVGLLALAVRPERR